MFEIVEHPADVGFRVSAASLPQLFESAAEALTDLAMDTADVRPRRFYPLAAQGEDLEELLVNWLSEVLYLIDGERLALGRFSVKELAPDQVSGMAAGEPCDPVRHPAKHVIKGVTYHQLKIVQENCRWSCEVYLDV